MAEAAFSKDDKARIVKAIQEAEVNTSGEVQVHIENHCKKPVMERAAEVFKVLKMDKTALRNGVLFYLAVKDHRFAILGDKGINEKVPENFWDQIRDHMKSRFVAGEFTEGLCEGIGMAGKALGEHFPYAGADDINELPDEISFGNN